MQFTTTAAASVLAFLAFRMMPTGTAAPAPTYCENSMGHDPCFVTDDPSCTNDDGFDNIPETTYARLVSWYHELYGTGEQKLKGSGAGLSGNGGSLLGGCCSNYCLYVSNDGASYVSDFKWSDSEFLTASKKLDNTCVGKASSGSKRLKGDPYVTLNFQPSAMAGANFNDSQKC